MCFIHGGNCVAPQLKNQPYLVITTTADQWKTSERFILILLSVYKISIYVLKTPLNSKLIVKLKTCQKYTYNYGI